MVPFEVQEAFAQNLVLLVQGTKQTMTLHYWNRWSSFLHGQALLETFSTYLGKDWTPDLATAWTDAYGAIATTMFKGAEHPKENLQPELTFYEWVDLDGESSPRVKGEIAVLTDYHYGNRPKAEVVEDV